MYARSRSAVAVFGLSPMAKKHDAHATQHLTCYLIRNICIRGVKDLPVLSTISGQGVSNTRSRVPVFWRPSLTGGELQTFQDSLQVWMHSLHTHLPMHAHTHTHAHTRSNARKHTYARVHANTCTHMYRYTHIHARPHTHTHTLVPTDARLKATFQQLRMHRSFDTVPFLPTHSAHL